MVNQNQELIVRGEQVERIYISYLAKKYLVNRRYQRKLIWTLQEKQSFIDSIINGFPIPIILLAEPKGRQDNALELTRIIHDTCMIGRETMFCARVP
ncbi:hypothetical protein RA2_02776 [Roseovarius sp. A-2]|nr:hypothetical protein RA2_02776 [Roseovarius sp. A-2]